MGRRSLHGTRRCESCGCVIEKGYKCDRCKAEGKEASRQAYYESQRLRRHQTRKIDPSKEKRIEVELAAGELKPWLDQFVEIGQHGPCRSIKGKEFSELAKQYQSRECRRQSVVVPYAPSVGR